MAAQLPSFGDLLARGHDRLAVAEDSPVAFGEVASRERAEIPLLAEHV